MKRTTTILTTILTLALLISTTTACNFWQLFDNKGDKPYGALYDDAKDWATYWCGPCKQLDMKTIPDEPRDTEVYTMKDKEYGFIYQVEANYIDSNQPTYTYGNFDHEYIEVFLDETDYSDLIGKYDLKIELKDIDLNYDGETYSAFYHPEIEFRTERNLTNDEMKEILEFTYYALKDFDAERQHFTRNDYCKYVSFSVWCAPSEKDKSLGRVYSTSSGMFGYETEHRQR